MNLIFISNFISDFDKRSALYLLAQLDQVHKIWWWNQIFGSENDKGQSTKALRRVGVRKFSLSYVYTARC